MKCGYGVALTEIYGEVFLELRCNAYESENSKQVFISNNNIAIINCINNRNKKRHSSNRIASTNIRRREIHAS